MIPKEVGLTIGANNGSLDQTDFEILRAIKLTVADAGKRDPADVLQYVLDAVRAHGAKTLEIAPAGVNAVPNLPPSIEEIQEKPANAGKAES